jgi:alcohol dehydrogenase class IV
MRFEFATATRIIFGRGAVQEVAQSATKLGSHAFVVTGRTNKRVAPILEQLNKNQIKCETFNVSGEPTTAIAKEAISQSRRAGCNLVISIGGGSVLDTGKAMTNSGELEDYLEVVGDGKPLTNNCKPHIAIPTTAGTGAEVTRNSVLGVPEYKVKVSMRSPLMLPTVAVVDPELTYSMPQSITAYTGLDALTQLMEAYVSNKANPLTDGICREGLKRAGCSLQRAYEDRSNHAAREDMSLASLFGGLALANAKLGAVHGFAGPLGGMISAPHGAICAGLLPYVSQANVQALQKRANDSPALARYDEVAQLLTGTVTAKAIDGIEFVQNLCRVLKVPPLSKFGLKEQDFPIVVEKSHKSSSMKGNPITLTENELLKILQKSM